jgi:hypothetical protein
MITIYQAPRTPTPPYPRGSGVRINTTYSPFYGIPLGSLFPVRQPTRWRPLVPEASQGNVVSRIWKGCKLFIGTAIMALACDSDTLELVLADEQMRKDIREEMSLHRPDTISRGLNDVVSDVHRRGYDLTNNREIEYIQDATQNNTLDQLPTYGGKIIAPQPLWEPVTVIPRFAASMTCALRAKFGILEENDANKLLLQREYLRMCREGNVRNADVAAHQPYVMNAYFREDLYERIPKARMRLSWWMKRLLGIQTTKSNLSVC